MAAASTTSPFPGDPECAAWFAALSKHAGDQAHVREVADGKCPYLELRKSEFTKLPYGVFVACTRLTEIELAENTHITALPDSLGLLQDLGELNLNECTALVTLPECFGDLHALTRLLLHECTSLTALPESFGQLKALTNLDLSYCTSLVTLPESFGRLQALTELDLNECDSLTALPESFGHLRALTDLSLNNCNSLTALPESLGQLQALTKFFLAGCRGLTTLPDSIGNLKALTKLYLAGCSGLTVLPESMGRLQSLTMLDLGFCTYLTALPESLGQLQSVTTLGALSWCPRLASESHTRSDRFLKRNIRIRDHRALRFPMTTNDFKATVLFGSLLRPLAGAGGGGGGGGGGANDGTDEGRAAAPNIPLLAPVLGANCILTQLNGRAKRLVADYCGGNILSSASFDSSHSLSLARPQPSVIQSGVCEVGDGN